MSRNLGWVLLVFGALLGVQGLIGLVWRIPGIPRLEAAGVFLMGAGVVLQGLSRFYTFPGEDPILWAGVLFLFTGIVLQWRSG